MVDEYKYINGTFVVVARDGVQTPEGLEYEKRMSEEQKQVKDDRENIFKNIDPDLLARFKVYHKDNPHVYKLFMECVEQLKKAGRQYYSAWAIINRIRWDFDISTKGDQFKISNDYIALYARLAYYKNPGLKDFFVMKPMKGE